MHKIKHCMNVWMWLVTWVVSIKYLLFPICFFLALAWDKCISPLKCLQPVEVCVPYHRTKRKEVVVRTFDGQSWSTLPTELRRGSESHSSHPGGRPARVTHKTCYCKWILLQLFFLSWTNSITILVVKLASFCTFSWHAAQWTTFLGLWPCLAQ